MYRELSVHQRNWGAGGKLRFLLAMGCLFASPAILAEQRNCQVIDTLPATIAGGTYCLARNLSTAQLSGPAIRIGTSAQPGSNTVLDCNGHVITGSGNRGVQTTTGILAREPGASNVTVRNCVVTGFINGIIVDVPQAYVANNRLHDNYNAGIMVRDGATVVGNHVMRTGGATMSLPMEAVAILAGPASTIRDNTVHWVFPSDSRPVYGIRLVYGSQSLVERNHVADVVGNLATPSGIGIQNLAGYGEVGGTIYRDNTVVSVNGLPDTGIACSPGDVAVANVILGFHTGTSGCSNSGNVVAP